jgi:putative methionine-R-sulfoxide reductase with GAF domain
MSTRYRADEYAAIAQHLKELEAEKTARINGISLEDAKPVEAPEDIDWAGMYGYRASVNSVAWTEWGEPYNTSYLAKA